MRLITIFLILFSVSQYAQTTRYVSKTGTNEYPYTDWKIACDSIQPVIDICEPWDTILIGKGEFYGNIVNNHNPVVIMGVSRDSSIILPDLPGTTSTVLLETYKELTVQNICFNGFAYNNKNCGVYAWDTKLEINNVSFVMINSGVGGNKSDIIIEYCFFELYNSPKGLRTSGYKTPPSKYNVSNNLFIFPDGGEACHLSDRSDIIFNNNIVRSLLDPANGINHMGYNDTIIAYNNLIISEITAYGFKTDEGRHYAECVNNTFILDLVSMRGRTGGWADSGKCINNIVINSHTGFHGPMLVDYNLFYNVDEELAYTCIDGGHNIFDTDPMIKTEISYPTSDIDAHLQKHSPAIDAGDPAILDKDGTRSDIGYLGGPAGESYIYEDLPPKIPKDITGSITQDSILTIKWRPNGEADLAYYKLYHGDNENFVVNDSSYLFKLEDNFVSINLNEYNTPGYFAVTAVDTGNREGDASERLHVVISNVEKDIEYIESYDLMQNYPNPFNPSTTIRYRLKAKGNVTMRLYNINGEKVTDLFNGVKDRGVHELKFDSGEYALASGIYLLSMQVSDNNKKPVYNNTRKLVLLK